MMTALLVLICAEFIHSTSATLAAWGGAGGTAGWDMWGDPDWDPTDSSLDLPADYCAGLLPWPTWSQDAGRFGSDDGDGVPLLYDRRLFLRPSAGSATFCAVDPSTCFEFPPMPGEPGCMPADDEHDPFVRHYNLQSNSPASRLFAPPSPVPERSASPVLAATCFRVGASAHPHYIPVAGTEGAAADWLCSLVSSWALNVVPDRTAFTGRTADSVLGCGNTELSAQPGDGVLYAPVACSSHAEVGHGTAGPSTATSTRLSSAGLSAQPGSSSHHAAAAQSSRSQPHTVNGNTAVGASRAHDHGNTGPAVANHGAAPTPAVPTIDGMGDINFLEGLYSNTPVGILVGSFTPETLQVAKPSFIDALSPDGPRVLQSRSKVTKTSHGWVLGHCRDLAPADQQQLSALLESRFKPVCATGFQDLGQYNGALGPITIPVKDPGKRVFAAARRYGHFDTQVMHDKVPPLIAAGIVVKCPSNMYASNNVIAAKKDADGQYTDARFCHNYRPINQEIASDTYCLPLADQLHLEVANSRIFSKIDARSGFLQIPIHVDDQPKTAFWYNQELWMYTRMPFGMKNSPAEFQKRMDRAIQDAGLSHCCRVYIDDVLVHSANPADHLKHLATVFDMLEANGLKAHPDKSIFAAEIIEFLGHDVSHYGLSPSEAKLRAIRGLPEPCNVPDLRRVLGFMGYYRCYVPNYSAISLPLTKLTGKDVPWEWRPGVEGKAYQELKDQLCRPDCALKRADLSKPFLLHTDFCNHGLGAVLGQVDDQGQEHIVACISRSLNKYEKNYASYKGEMLAAVWAVRAFDYYLRGTQFTLVTDHSPLVFLMTNDGLQGQYARWALILQEYNFTIAHRPGVKHQNADTLSRHPLESSADNTGARMDVDAGASSADLGTGAASVIPTHLVPGLAAHGHMSAFMAHNPRRCRTAVEHSDSTGLRSLACSAELDAASWRDIHAHACATFTVAPAIDGHAEQRETALHGGPDDWPEGDAAYAAWSTLGALSAAAELAPKAPAYQPLRTCGPMDSNDVYPVVGLCTYTLPPDTVTGLAADGVTLYEPFGGLCAGLEMLLRSGVRVRRYLYSDISAQARAVAKHRLTRLTQQYGSALLPAAAYADAFSALPQDVYAISTDHLRKAGALDGTQWMVVAGWECQDLSPAGAGRGLQGSRSSSFFPLVNIIGTLQQLQLRRPPAYLLENTAMQCSPSFTSQLQGDYATICERIGTCVLLDAARVDSCAHRLRDYWTNLADATAIQGRLDLMQRQPAACLQRILEPGRRPKTCRSTNPSPPYYPANTRGQPLVVLPTLMATINSYSFRGEGQGLVLDASGAAVPLTIAERERALGYAAGCTAAPGLSDADRHRITGNCMDANALHRIFTVALAIQAGADRRLYTHPPGHTNYCHAGGGRDTTACCVTVIPPQPAQSASSSGTVTPPQHAHPADVYSANMALLAQAQVQDDALGRDTDIWDDRTCLEYLQFGEFSSTTIARSSVAELRRAVRRSRSYIMRDDKLFRCLAPEERREVLRPNLRAAAVKAAHERCGHFGRKRTTHLLLLSYWWQGIYQDVRRCIDSCQSCSQVKASGFNSQQPVLSPLPIQGMFYRWHVDLCGPFPESKHGYKYIMVAVEAFSKHAELVPIRDKSAPEVAYAFLHNVLGRFGACAEVVTDQGTEFQAEFQDLLSDAFIDHRTTSSHHPQANGLAERAVQTLKMCLKKHMHEDMESRTWDELVAWIALGYRCSPQAATGIAPYQMLYATHPTVPPAIKDRIKEPLRLDDPEAAGELLLKRAKAVKRYCTIAGENLLIAQHRDTLRYAKLRSGGYLPKILRFEVGDYVYVRRNTSSGKAPSSLEALARPEILRIREVRPSGVLVLQGRCGRTIIENPVNCAPCHLPIVDGDLDLAQAKPTVDVACEKCRLPDNEHIMLMCDSCDHFWHTYCLEPPLYAVPQGTWVCPPCIAAGVNPATVTTARADAIGERARTRPSKTRTAKVAPPTAEPAPRPPPTPGATSAARTLQVPLPDHQESLLYHRRTVQRQRTTKTGIREPVEGTVEYLGPNHLPHPFRITYPDGSVERQTLRVVRRDIMPMAVPHAHAPAPLAPPPAPALGSSHPVTPELPQGRAPVRRSSRLTAAVSAIGTQSCSAALPDFQLTTTAGMKQALHTLMPGAWTDGHATKLSCHVPGGRLFHQTEGTYHPGEPQRVATALPEIQELLLAVDFTGCRAILDPFAGDDNIRTAFNAAELDVLTNDVNPLLDSDHHMNALQPSTYAALQEGQQLDAVVMSPFFTVLDLALPLAVHHAEQVVCCHVPGHYVTNAPRARMDWLGQLQAEERLMLIVGLPRGPTGRRCMWLIIFKTKRLRDRMTRPHARGTMGLHLATATP